MTDIAAIRKRAAFCAAPDGRQYHSLQRADSHGREAPVFVDAFADREDLLREVDRLSAEQKTTQERLGTVQEEWLTLLREHAALTAELETARTAAQNEATQRQKAEAERDQARATLALHPFGACTCCGEGTCPWCHVTEVKEQNDMLRAELEALRAPLPDAELAEIEERHDIGSNEPEDVNSDEYVEHDRAWSEAHNDRGTLLRALRAERAGGVDKDLQWNRAYDRLIEESGHLRALLSSCRPVVEAVRAYQRTQAEPERAAVLSINIPRLP